MNIVETGQIYTHYKGGNYEILGIGTDTEGMQPVVIYRTPDFAAGRIWVRPLRLFTGMVFNPAVGEEVKRFVLSPPPTPFVPE